MTHPSSWLILRSSHRPVSLLFISFRKLKKKKNFPLFSLSVSRCIKILQRWNQTGRELHFWSNHLLHYPHTFSHMAHISTKKQKTNRAIVTGGRELFLEKNIILLTGHWTEPSHSLQPNLTTRISLTLALLWWYQTWILSDCCFSAFSLCVLLQFFPTFRKIHILQLLRLATLVQPTISRLFTHVLTFGVDFPTF